MKINYSYEPFYPAECAILLCRALTPIGLDSSDQKHLDNIDNFLKDIEQSHPSRIGELKERLKPLMEVSDYVLKSISTPPERLDYFFGAKSDCIFTPGMVLALMELHKIDTASLKDSDRREIIFSFLQTYFIPIDSLEAVCDEVSFLSWLESQKLCSEDKWSCMMFYHNVDSLQKEFRVIITEATELYLNKRDVWAPILEKSIDNISRALSDNSNYFSEMFNIEIDCENMTIFPSLSCFNALSLTCFSLEKFPAHDGDYLQIGYLIEEFFTYDRDDEQKNERLCSQLKALGDNRRITILTHIKNHPLCGQEIAELIGITPATVSHHMNELVSNDLVSITKDGNKIMYHYSENGALKFLADLKNFFSV